MFKGKWSHEMPRFRESRGKNEYLFKLLKSSLLLFERILAHQFPTFEWCFETCIIRNKNGRHEDVFGYSFSIFDHDNEDLDRQFWGPMNNWVEKEEFDEGESMEVYSSWHIDGDDGVLSLASESDCPIGLVYAVFYSYMQVKAWTLRWLCSDTEAPMTTFVARKMMACLRPEEIFLMGRQIRSRKDCEIAVQEVIDNNAFDILTPTLTFEFRSIFHCIHILRVRELERLSLKFSKQLENENKKKKKKKRKNIQKQNLKFLAKNDAVVRATPKVEFLAVLKWRLLFLEKRKLFLERNIC
jgi:hypothetical protein